jgi:hypothetical protein
MPRLYCERQVLTMSMLRSVIYEKFPYVDNYGHHEEDDPECSIHIAHSGFDIDLVHIGLQEGDNEARVNVGIDMAEKIAAALQLMVDDYRKRKAEHD